jgi:hypothetical protein
MSNFCQWEMVVENQLPEDGNQLQAKMQIESAEEEKLLVLRAEVAVGIADIAAGRMRSFDDVDELEAYLDKIIEEALATE